VQRADRPAPEDPVGALRQEHERQDHERRQDPVEPTRGEPARRDPEPDVEQAERADHDQHRVQRGFGPEQRDQRIEQVGVERLVLRNEVRVGQVARGPRVELVEEIRRVVRLHEARAGLDEAQSTHAGHEGQASVSGEAVRPRQQRAGHEQETHRRNQQNRGRGDVFSKTEPEPVDERALVLHRPQAPHHDGDACCADDGQRHVHHTLALEPQRIRQDTDGDRREEVGLVSPLGQRIGERAPE
jgi:hypothetical protein